MIVEKRCRYVGGDGVQCGQTTIDATGYCLGHRERVRRLIDEIILRCEDCAILDRCDFRDRGQLGLCHFEVSDGGVQAFGNKDRLAKEMRRVLRNEGRHLKRLERELTMGKIDGVERLRIATLTKEVRREYYQHLDSFAKFQGWIEPKITAEERRERLKALGKIFIPSKKPEAEKPKEDEEQQKEGVIVAVVEGDAGSDMHEGD